MDIALLPAPNLISLSAGINFKITDQISPNIPIAILSNHCNGSSPQVATLIALPVKVRKMIYKTKMNTNITKK
jgi:hypothetical protein